MPWIAILKGDLLITVLSEFRMPSGLYFYHIPSNSLFFFLLIFMLFSISFFSLVLFLIHFTFTVIVIFLQPNFFYIPGNVCFANIRISILIKIRISILKANHLFHATISL